MSNARDHHAQAEQLLGQARAEQDSIRRHLILAEAQVHATLAQGVPAGRMPGQVVASGSDPVQVPRFTGGRGEGGGIRETGPVPDIDLDLDLMGDPPPVPTFPLPSPIDPWSANRPKKQSQDPDPTAPDALGNPGEEEPGGLTPGM